MEAQFSDAEFSDILGAFAEVDDLLIGWDVLMTPPRDEYLAQAVDHFHTNDQQRLNSASPLFDLPGTSDEAVSAAASADLGVVWPVLGGDGQKAPRPELAGCQHQHPPGESARPPADSPAQPLGWEFYQQQPQVQHVHGLSQMGQAQLQPGSPLSYLVETPSSSLTADPSSSAPVATSGGDDSQPRGSLDASSAGGCGGCDNAAAGSCGAVVSEYDGDGGGCWSSALSVSPQQLPPSLRQDFGGGGGVAAYSAVGGSVNVSGAHGGLTCAVLPAAPAGAGPLQPPPQLLQWPAGGTLVTSDSSGTVVWAPVARLPPQPQPAPSCGLPVCPSPGSVTTGAPGFVLPAAPLPPAPPTPAAGPGPEPGSRLAMGPAAAAVGAWGSAGHAPLTQRPSPAVAATAPPPALHGGYHPSASAGFPAAAPAAAAAAAAGGSQHFTAAPAGAAVVVTTATAMAAAAAAATVPQGVAGGAAAAVPLVASGTGSVIPTPGSTAGPAVTAPPLPAPPPSVTVSGSALLAELVAEAAAGGWAALATGLAPLPPGEARSAEELLAGLDLQEVFAPPKPSAAKRIRGHVRRAAELKAALADRVRAIQRLAAENADLRGRAKVLELVVRCRDEQLRLLRNYRTSADGRVYYIEQQLGLGMGAAGEGGGEGGGGVVAASGSGGGGVLAPYTDASAADLATMPAAGLLEMFRKLVDDVSASLAAVDSGDDVNPGLTPPAAAARPGPFVAAGVDRGAAALQPATGSAGPIVVADAKAQGVPAVARLRTQMALFRNVLRYLGLVNEEACKFADTTLTGQTAVPAPGHWLRVVTCLGLSQQQLADAAALHACWQEWLSRIHRERRSIAAALDELLSVNRYGATYFESVGQYGTDRDAIHKMHANVMRERILVVLTGEVFCCHILTDVQWARAVVYSRPYILDVRELVRAASQLYYAGTRGLAAGPRP